MLDENWKILYYETDSFEDLESKSNLSVGMICFYNKKLLLVYSTDTTSWEMPGGMREAGESIETCAERELKEESNMKIKRIYPLGYDLLTNTETGEILYQVRFAVEVRPIGKFSSDPAGEITRIKFVELEDYKKHINWGVRLDLMLNKAFKFISHS